MPIYAYRCAACGHAKDVLRKLSDPPLADCPACGEPRFEKQLTAAGFQLKGSGWYVTDFRDGNKGGKADKPGDKATDKSEDKPAGAATDKAAPADGASATKATGDSAAASSPASAPTSAPAAAPSPAASPPPAAPSS
jgi:putative FmdB family regulatory protein